MYMLRAIIARLWLPAWLSVAIVTIAAETGDASADDWVEIAITDPELEANAVAISSDGKLVAWGQIRSGSKLAPIIVMDTKTGKVLSRLRGQAFTINAVEFLEDGKRLVSADDRGFMSIWDVESGKEISAARGHEDQVRELRAYGDGKRFASAGYDGYIRYWADTLDKPVGELSVLGGLTIDMSFSPDSKSIAVAGQSEAYVYPLDADFTDVRTADRYEHMNGIDVTSDGKFLLVITARGGFHVLEYATLKEVTAVPTKVGMESVRSLKSASECVLGGFGGRVEVFDYAAMQSKVLYDPKKGESCDFGTCVDVSADGSVVAAGSLLEPKLWRRTTPKK